MYLCTGDIEERLQWSITPDKRIMGAAGSEANLNCPAEGFPSPQFSWFKDGTRLDFKESNSKVRKSNVILNIKNRIYDKRFYYRQVIGLCCCYRNAYDYEYM